MSDDITQRLRAAVPKMPDSGTPIAWPCKVRSELLLEAAAEIERLRAEMLDLAEWCETEEPLSYKQLSHRLRAALEGKP